MSGEELDRIEREARRTPFPGAGEGPVYVNASDWDNLLKFVRHLSKHGMSEEARRWLWTSFLLGFVSGSLWSTLVAIWAIQYWRVWR